MIICKGKKDEFEAFPFHTVFLLFVLSYKHLRHVQFLNLEFPCALPKDSSDSRARSLPIRFTLPHPSFTPCCLNLLASWCVYDWSPFFSWFLTIQGKINVSTSRKKIIFIHPKTHVMCSATQPFLVTTVKTAEKNSFLSHVTNMWDAPKLRVFSCVCVCVCVCDRITHYHETKGITNFTELKQTMKIRDPENDITIEIM